VEYVFGIPGGPLLGFFEALKQRSKIRFVLAKHEGGAAYMAAAHARVRSSLAVCCVTSGPGATNALTGIASAYADSLPVLVLTGQVASHVFGRGAIQESSVFGTNVVDLFRPVTLQSLLLPAVQRVPHILRAAIRTAMAGRRGPVHLSMPADMLPRPVRYELVPPEHYRYERAAYDVRAIERLASLIRGARRPYVIAGNGVAASGATAELGRLARAQHIPVATSPKGKGTFPENDELSLGVLGFGGHTLAQRYLDTAQVDLVLIIGSSMNEFVTNGFTLKLPEEATVVQLDIDPNMLGRSYPVHLGIVGDARSALAALLDRLPATPSGSARDIGALSSLRREVPRYLAAEALSSDQTPIKPQRLIRELREAMPENALLFVDNGTSIIWAEHYFEAREPDCYFIDLGLAAMGSAVAGVVGGALAAPGRRAYALVGDAAFAMHGTEVHTAVEQALPIVWIVLNNGGHGMVHQGETITRGADLGTSMFGTPIDVAAMARSLGAKGVRIESPLELRRALEEALGESGPTVIDAVIDGDEVAPTLLHRARTLEGFIDKRVPGEEAASFPVVR